MGQFAKELIRLDRHFTGKRECLDAMVKMLVQVGIMDDVEPFLDTVWKRECELSTGIGRGIAIPHARHDSVRKLAIAVVRTLDDLDFSALDGKPVRLIFLSAIPADNIDEYRNSLGRLSTFLRSAENRQRLLSTPNESTMYEILKEVEV